MKEFFKSVRAMLTLGAKLLKMTLEVMRGAYKISRLSQPVVSIFGGHLLPRNSAYLQSAHYLASRLVEQDISVLTGGGPGIMEAANSGAAHQHDEKFRSMGIGVRGLKGEKGFNPYVHEGIMLDYFFARKYLLINYSYAFVLFPGGLGTLDELADLLNLMETNQRVHAPIVLYGKDFWAPYLEWIDRAKAEGLIDPEGAVRSLYCVDTSDDALKILVSYCERCVHV
jgi:uncharacterized protein (TIGR00730 family)